MDPKKEKAVKLLTLTLQGGITLTDTGSGAETVQREVELREPNAGDLIDAQAESEQLVHSKDDGYQLVMSPTLMNLNLLRRRIVRIGTIEGPITLNMLRRLTAGDLRSLNDAAIKHDAAALLEVEQRGRSAAGS